MCGICGYFDLSNRGRVHRDLLKSMSMRLAHRGPDASGFMTEPNSGFGFRRLSILDPDRGSQPVFSEDRGVVTVCNGEIFNFRELRAELISRGHRLVSDCDAEILPHLFEDRGIDLLQQLNGQFGFAIYDRRCDVLYVARDHFGIIPIYFTVCEGLFLFASEIKALLEYPSIERQINLNGLNQLLSLPGIPNPTTMFSGIRALQPGHFLKVSGDGIRDHTYWDLEYPVSNDVGHNGNEAFYREQLEELLIKSVKRRLQADVPLGFYLSGGLDSSLILGMAARACSVAEPRSFSVVFPGQEMCESQYQRAMVALVSKPDTQKYPSPAKPWRMS